MLGATKSILLVGVTKIELKLGILVLWLAINTFSDVIFPGLQDDPGFKLTEKLNWSEALVILEVSLCTELQDAFDHLFVKAIVLLVINVSSQSNMEN